MMMMMMIDSSALRIQEGPETKKKRAIRAKKNYFMRDQAGYIQRAQ